MSSLIDELNRHNSASITALVNSGVNLNQRDDASGEFPLHVAVKHGLNDIVSLLLDKGAKPSCNNSNGLTPLHYAARKGNLEVLNLLLQKGAAITADATSFWTPLHYAAYHGHERIVERLLAVKGTGPDLVNETDSFNRTALHVACKQGHIEIINLLLRAGAIITDDTTNHSPFSYLQAKDSEDFSLDPKYDEASKSAFCNDMRSLLTNGTHSDVTFVVSGMPETLEDGTIPMETNPTIQNVAAHRAIISARCPSLLEDSEPFRKLVDGGKQIQISGVTHSLFNAILEYIYSGGISDAETDLDFAINLAKKGTELNMPLLSSFAENMILANLDNDNVVSILEAAIAINCCPRVEEYCKYYIIRFYDKVQQVSGPELKKFDGSILCSVISKLNIVPAPAPSSDAIDKAPTDFLQPEKPSNLSSSTASLSASGQYLPSAAAHHLPPPSHHMAPPSSHAVTKTSTPRAPKKVATKSHKAEPISKHVAPSFAAPRPISTASLIAPPPQGRTTGTGSDALVGGTYDMVRGVHDQILKMPAAEVFAEPVDWKAFGFLDYPYIVPDPMDLGTISKHLRSKNYKTVREWAADVRLVWDNAKTYNAVGSDVHNSAELFSQLFENTYLNIKLNLGLGQDYDPFFPKSPDLYATIYEQRLAQYRSVTGITPPMMTPLPTMVSPKAGPKKSGSKVSPGIPATNRQKRKSDAEMPPARPIASPMAAAGVGGGVHQMNVPVAAPMVPSNVPSSSNSHNNMIVSSEPVFTPLSTVEREELEQRMQTLTEENIMEVISILNIQPEPSGEIEITLDALAPEAARRLQSYVLGLGGGL